MQLASVSREGIVAGQRLDLDLKPIALRVYGPNGVWAAGNGVYLDNQRIGEVDFKEAYIPRYSGPGLAFSFAEN